ncbi:MAG: DNA helicase RecQ [Oscillospiraceae bacterium]|nr:DNA helicase RecQ [Oscillospiraceae bacterium]
MGVGGPMSPLDKYQLLERCFGYTTFRPGQEELIDGVLSGRDVFGIMPTGGGKSICYQVPALLLPGVTLVVSPLISLMRDQVLALKAAGVPAAYINSSLTGPQMQAVYRNLLAGKYKIVYVAPERLDYGGFGGVVQKLDISFVAVDEAHCISQWGQDFRPSYLRVVQFIQSLPRRPVVGAFTATATAQVREDVERLLGLHDPVRTVTGFDRPNLYFEVVRPKRKDPELLELLSGRKKKSGIVYCATRKKVEAVCELLQSKGFAATRYHAGLEEAERARNQEDFLYDRSTVMVATNAFGMGIDKSNVSFVIHYNMPKSIEAYYQEAGRAGRDGTEADCLLLYNGSDVTTARFLIDNASDNEELDEAQRELVRQQDLKRLDAMVGYCKTENCLRGYILEYFGQKHVEVCGNCGSCLGDYEVVDITREAQMFLSCVQRIRDKLGYCVDMATVAKVLQGSKEKAILEKGLGEVTTFGLMKDMGRSQIRGIGDHLEALGYLVTEGEHMTVGLTASAAEVLFRGQTVQMKQRKEAPEELPKAASPEVLKLAEEDRELYDALRALRGTIARDAGIPPYMVFSNATLADMARKKPRTGSQFRKVSGVGQIKAEWYADDFLGRIQEFLETQG